MIKELVVGAYSIGAILAQVLWVVFIIALLSRKKFSWAKRLVRWVHKHALFIAALVATLAMAGSLFFSEILLWKPCLFCWYQRIAIFPLVFILWPAYKQKFRNITWYALPLAIIGALFAVYHWFLQLSPIDHTTKCLSAEGVSCVGRYIYQYGHITIAGLALTALVIIITLLLLQHRRRM